MSFVIVLQESIPTNYKTLLNLLLPTLIIMYRFLYKFKFMYRNAFDRICAIYYVTTVAT